MKNCCFCGKSQARARGLVASTTPPACICNECLDVCRNILEEDKKHPEDPGTYRAATSSEKKLACGFCRRSQKAVDKLISSPAGASVCCICDRCVDQCRRDLAAQDLPEKDSLLKRLVRNVTGKVRHYRAAMETASVVRLR